MKKRFISVILTLAAVLSMAVMPMMVKAADEEVVELSPVASYENKVYNVYFAGTNGGIVFSQGNVVVNGLPGDFNAKADYGYISGYGYIWSFAFYNDKIYYMAGSIGSDICPTSIYCCNIDGTNNILIADDAANYSSVFITDNVLYYNAMTQNNQDYNGRICKIKLDDLSKKEIVSVDAFMYLDYCDGDYIYYRYYKSNSFGYYKADINGNGVSAVSNSLDEFDYHSVIRGDKTYYIDNNVLYEKNRNGSNVKKICDTDDNSYVANVTGDNIYYYTTKFLTSTKKYKAYVYEIERPYDGIRVYLNNEEIEFDQEPINQDGNLLVPIRAIAEAMGKTVLWSDEYKAAFIDNTDNALIIPIEDNNQLNAYEQKAIFIADDGGYYSWERKQTNVQPLVLNGRTLVPIRQFAEALGADVEWVQDENAAYITYTETDAGEMDDSLYDSINLNYYIARYSENPFAEYTDIIDSFYDERNKTADAITMGLSSMFDTPSDLWRMGLYGETNASMAIQQALYDVINEIPESGTEVTADVSILKDLKSYATTAKKIYDKANGIDEDFLEAHSTLKYLNDTIEDLGDLFDFTVFTTEEIAYLLSDYSENLAYINAFESAMLSAGALDSNLQTAITQLKREYTEQFYQVVKDTYEETVSKTYSTVLSTLTGGTYSIGKTVLKAIFKASGISSKGSALETFYSICSFNSALDTSFALAVKEAKNDSLDTAPDLTQLKALFAFEIAAKKTMFSSMKTVSDWWAADTYNAMLDSFTYYIWDAERES